MTEPSRLRIASSPLLVRSCQRDLTLGTFRSWDGLHLSDEGVEGAGAWTVGAFIDRLHQPARSFLSLFARSAGQLSSRSPSSAVESFFFFFSILRRLLVCVLQSEVGALSTGSDPLLGGFLNSHRIVESRLFPAPDLLRFPSVEPPPPSSLRLVCVSRSSSSSRSSSTPFGSRSFSREGPTFGLDDDLSLSPPSLVICEWHDPPTITRANQRAASLRTLFFISFFPTRGC